MPPGWGSWFSLSLSLENRDYTCAGRLHGLPIRDVYNRVLDRTIPPLLASQSMRCCVPNYPIKLLPPNLYQNHMPIRIIPYMFILKTVEVGEAECEPPLSTFLFFF